MRARGWCGVVCVLVWCGCTGEEKVRVLDMEDTPRGEEMQQASDMQQSPDLPVPDMQVLERDMVSRDQDGEEMMDDMADSGARDQGETPVIEGTVLQAFPSAVGFGRVVSGGRGGEVRRVTNLNDAGPGSLREAWETSGKAYVVFDVAGYITLASPIQPADDKTLLGQSAFRAGGEGVTLRGNGAYDNGLVTGAFKRQAIRYMRFRRGPGVQGECCGDNFEPYQGGEMIIDHSSFSWSTDENLSFSESPTYTVQYSIVSEALNFSTHAYSTPGNPQYRSPHSMGSLNAYAQTDMTWYGNYFAHNNQRNALFSEMTLPVTRIEYVNNVCYNWGAFGNVYGRSDGTNFEVNIINNRAKKGANTSARRLFFSIPTDSTNPAHRFYVSGNITDRRPSNDLPEWAAIGDGSANEPAGTAYQASQPFAHPLQGQVTPWPASELSARVLSHVGASLFRDAVDQRVVLDYEQGTGGFIDSPDEVGGYPALSDVRREELDDGDNDGMSDAWERVHGVEEPGEVKTMYEIEGRRWLNPGYEAIEVFYFTRMDLEALGIL